MRDFLQSIVALTALLLATQAHAKDTSTQRAFYCPLKEHAPTSIPLAEQRTYFNVEEVTHRHFRLIWPPEGPTLMTMDIKLSGPRHPTWKSEGKFGRSLLTPPRYQKIDSIFLAFSADYYGPNCRGEVPLQTSPEPLYPDLSTLEIEVPYGAPVSPHYLAAMEQDDPHEDWTHIILGISMKYGAPNIFEICEHKNPPPNARDIPPGGTFSIALSHGPAQAGVSDVCWRHRNSAAEE